MTNPIVYTNLLSFIKILESAGGGLTLIQNDTNWLISEIFPWYLLSNS